MKTHPDALLRLMHLADSALPIGSAAHSFGLETLIAEGELTVPALTDCFHAMLTEVGLLEAVFTRRAYRIGTELYATAPQPIPQTSVAYWVNLNHALSARKPARESREAGATLGRRLLRLALSLEEHPGLRAALHADDDARPMELHHSTVFGLIGGVWSLGEDATVLAFLQQMLTGMLSACQKLMPLGQGRAQQILWELKPALTTIGRHSLTWAATGDAPAVPSFAPLLDLAGMRHPHLPVRLFIS